MEEATFILKFPENLPVPAYAIPTTPIIMSTNYWK